MSHGAVTTPLGGIERAARPMPVAVLADTSSSMAGAKIASLNEALRTMVEDFRADERLASSVRLTLITFDSEVRHPVVHGALAGLELPVLGANGVTRLGGALERVVDLLGDPERVPARCYTPTLILVSDGQPNDDWRGPLDRLKTHRRLGRAVRLALAVGSDADRSVLGDFAHEYPVLRADEPGKIKTFFRFATWVSREFVVSAGARRATVPIPDDLLP